MTYSLHYAVCLWLTDPYVTTKSVLRMSALILCVWTKHFLLRSSCVNIMLRIKRTCPRSQYPLSYRPRVGRHRWHRVKINGLSNTMPNLDIRELNESDLATQAHFTKPGMVCGRRQGEAHVQRAGQHLQDRNKLITGWFQANIQHLVDYFDVYRALSCLNRVTMACIQPIWIVCAQKTEQDSG